MRYLIKTPPTFQVVWLPHQIKRIKAEARVDWQSRNLTTIAKRDQKSVDYGGD